MRNTLKTLCVILGALAGTASGGVPRVDGQVQLQNGMDPNMYQNHYNGLMNPATMNFNGNGYNNPATYNPSAYGQDPYGYGAYNQGNTSQWGNFNNTMTNGTGNGPGLRDIISIFNAQDGSFGQRVFRTAGEIYLKPIANTALNGLMNRLPKFAGMSQGNQPMVGLPPQCDPYFMYRMQAQENQRRILNSQAAR